jgi:hypothetical protein
MLSPPEAVLDDSTCVVFLINSHLFCLSGTRVGFRLELYGPVYAEADEGINN